MVKFHSIARVQRKPRAAPFRCLYSGCASDPFTFTFANIGNVTSYLSEQNCLISSASPGSCAMNWLHGKPRTTSPRSLYVRYSSSNPLYCPVKPHLLATFTTSSTFPRYGASVVAVPSMAVTGMS